MAAFQVAKENFDRLVTESSGVVMLDFWSSGCGPCRAMMPTVERLAAEHPDKGFGAVNVDEEPEVAWAFKVMAVPAIVVFKDGNVVADAFGYQTKAALERLLDEAAAWECSGGEAQGSSLA